MSDEFFEPDGSVRVALLANIPAPYRVPVYDRLAERLGSSFRVLYMTDAGTAMPTWRGELAHDHVYLPGLSITRSRKVHGRDLQLRFGVWKELRAFRPDIVITGGFNPPMLAAFAYSQLVGARHVAISDAWLGSEGGLTRAHRAMRKVVYSRSRAFVGASEKTLDLFRRYGARARLFKAPLSIDNDAFASGSVPAPERPVDLLYVGRLIELKLPMFFVDVVRRVAERRPITVDIVGDGPLRDAMATALGSIGAARVHFTGYVRPVELPALYARSKLLAFPTMTDAWGIVANEACAAGTPVLTCANAGCAGELVVDDVSGCVLPIDPAVWASRILGILDDPPTLSRLSAGARTTVADYTFDAAASAVLAACSACM